MIAVEINAYTALNDSSNVERRLPESLSSRNLERSFIVISTLLADRQIYVFSNHKPATASVNTRTRSVQKVPGLPFPKIDELYEGCA